MSEAPLEVSYRSYITCLNEQDWHHLGSFVQDEVIYNGRPVGLIGYQGLLEGDFRSVPDLHFDIDFLVVQTPYVASRLLFDCTPKGELFGLPVNGRRVVFTENVFYQFRDEKIAEVWSVIDKASVGSQLNR
jgi:predicted ester cyclase